jgi:flagellum-specific peptidoglycan hydrolase FlgJ
LQRNLQYTVAALLLAALIAAIVALYHTPIEPSTTAITPFIEPVDNITPELIEPTLEEMLGSSDIVAQRAAADELIQAIVNTWPEGHRRDFLVSIAPAALISASTHCIPPSVTIGQAIIESGWGRSMLTVRHNNLFGVKTKAHSGVSLNTREVVNGEEIEVHANFQTYRDWEASVTAHDTLLERDRRYSAAKEHWRDWPTFLATIAPVYASDPAYVALVSRLIERYDLAQWDGLAQGIAVRHTNCP